MKTPHGETVARIEALIDSYGPMTRVEICQHIGKDRRCVSSIVSRMMKQTPRKPKRLYILRYVFDHEGERSYPRAVYALGDKPDARRPQSDPKAAKRRYNAKVKALNTANFVFNLGLPRRIYERRQSA